LAQFGGPIDRVILFDDLPVWVVTGYKHVRQVLTDEQLIKDPLRLPPGVHPFRGRRYPEDGYALGGRHLIASDAADHARLRRVSRPFFSRRGVQRWRSHIEDDAAALLDAVVARGGGELVGEVFEPVANTTICRVLGIPAASRPVVLAASQTLLAAIHPEDSDYRRIAGDLQDLLTRLLRDHDGISDDVIGAAAGAWRDGSLSLRDALGVVRQFITANTINTVSVLARGALTLLQDPKLAASVGADQNIVVALTEEVLRLQSSAPLATWRFAPRPMNLLGAELQSGDIVLAALDTADHDPTIFANPSQLRLDRPSHQHLAFGLGTHYCAGAELARLEIQIVLFVLGARAAHVHLTESANDLPWCPTVLCQGIARLPVTTTPIGDRS
jgi:cytochrome P450